MYNLYVHGFVEEWSLMGLSKCIAKYREVPIDQEQGETAFKSERHQLMPQQREIHQCDSLHK